MTRLERIESYRQSLLAAADRSQEHVDECKRQLALADLFFLLLFILKRKDINRDWLYERCNEVQRAPDGFLDLWSREHYKSTIITFARTIQDALRNPELTVGLFSHTRPAAKGFLRQIKVEFERNDELQRLFPDILYSNPHKDALKWSEDDGLILKRKSNPKEATIEAWGLVDGMPTGKHFQLRVYDDLIDRKYVTNPEMVRKVTEAWELSLALGIEGGTQRYIGTRYAFNDTYRTIIERQSAMPRVYTCTKEGVWPGTPVLMSEEELTRRRRDWGIYTFSAQMLQDPAADRQQGFKPEWLRYYDQFSEHGVNKYLLCDPANEKKRESDYTAIGIIALGSDNNYYLLDGIRDRLSLKERGDAIFEFHRRWKPDGVGYEKYGMQADIEYLQERMERESYRFDITALGGAVAKHDRIRKLVPVFEANRFWLPNTLIKTDYEKRQYDFVQVFVNEEYRAFPVGLHEDVFDMIARIVDPELNALWPKSKQPEDYRFARHKRRPQRNTSWMAA